MSFYTCGCEVLEGRHDDYCPVHSWRLEEPLVTHKDIAKQLAADAVYGTVAQTGEKLPSNGFKDHLLEKVTGHIEAAIKLPPSLSPAEQSLKEMGVPPIVHPKPTPTENRLSEQAAAIAAYHPRSLPVTKSDLLAPVFNTVGAETGRFVTKDSGQRRVFPTGSQRDVREGKGRYDLLPPSCIRRLAQLYERGAKKYGDRNWQKGQPLSSTTDSMLRHAFQYLEGDRSEDHLAAVAWNAFTLAWTEEQIKAGKLPADLNDLGVKL